MPDQDKIKSLAQQYFEKIRTIREHIHAHPELSFKEYKTSEYIQKHLKDAGVPFTSGHVERGLLHLLKEKILVKKQSFCVPIWMLCLLRRRTK